LSAISTLPEAIQLTWLPPHPEGPTITAYKVQYSPRADNSNPVEVELTGDELTCSGFVSPILTSENLCTEITGLKPQTTYRFKVQAQASSGNWGKFIGYFYSTNKLRRCSLQKLYLTNVHFLTYYSYQRYGSLWPPPYFAVI
jgi:hypothetical protein